MPRFHLWVAGVAVFLFSCAPDPVGGNAIEVGGANADTMQLPDTQSTKGEAAARRSTFGDAMSWYADAAESGDANAQFLYGLRLEKGLEVGADPDDAEAWFRRAAAQGHAEAQFKLALRLVEREPESEEIATLYEAAARRGLAAAQFNLGVLILNAAQEPSDRTEALAWVSIAAIAGLEAAVTLREVLLESLPATEIRQGEERLAALRQELAGNLVNLPGQ